MNDLLAAYHYLSRNWATVQASRICGCCNCLQIFPPDEIVAWVGLDFDRIDDPQAAEQQTALCPRCGREAVLPGGVGFAITPGFLDRMNEAWFQRTVIHKPRPKA